MNQTDTPQNGPSCSFVAIVAAIVADPALTDFHDRGRSCRKSCLNSDASFGRLHIQNPSLWVALFHRLWRAGAALCPRPRMRKPACGGVTFPTDERRLDMDVLGKIPADSIASRKFCPKWPSLPRSSPERSDHTGVRGKEDQASARDECVA